MPCWFWVAILQNFTWDSTSSWLHHTEHQTQQSLVGQNHLNSWAAQNSSLAVNRVRSCLSFWAHSTMNSWGSMRIILLLEKGMVFAGLLLQVGLVNIWKQRSTWIYYQVGLLPHLLNTTTSVRAGSVCGLGPKIICIDAAEKIKSQPAAHLKLSVTWTQMRNTRHKDDISHTWELSSTVAGAVKRPAINITISHSMRSHCFSGQGWDHSQGHRFTHSSTSTNRSMNILQTNASFSLLCNSVQQDSETSFR